jgi:hypothetical protein
MTTNVRIRTDVRPPMPTRSVLALLITLSLLAIVPVRVAIAQGQVTILPPNENFDGRTYSEWSARFWQWGLALPLDGHPFADSNPDFDLRANQTGKVWFWAAPDGLDPFTRTSTLPANKALFLTLLDAECSSLEEAPFHGDTEAEQRACAKFFADHIVPDSLFCIIDGVAVDNLRAFRFATPQFKFKAPTPWIFGTVGGEGTSVGDGYSLLLTSLPKGRHVIRYGGKFHFDADEAPFFTEFDVPKDVTINLTVE